MSRSGANGGPEVQFSLGLRDLYAGKKPYDLRQKFPESVPVDGYLPVHGTTNQKSLGVVFSAWYSSMYAEKDYASARKSLEFLLRWNLERGLMSLPISKKKGGGSGGEAISTSHAIQHWPWLAGARMMSVQVQDDELKELTEQLWHRIVNWFSLSFVPEIGIALTAGPRDYKSYGMQNRSKLFSDRGGDIIASDLHNYRESGKFVVPSKKLDGADGTGPFLARECIKKGYISTEVGQELPPFADKDSLSIGIRDGSRAVWMNTPPGGNTTAPGPRVATKYSRDMGLSAWVENPALVNNEQRWYHRLDAEHPGPWTEEWEEVYVTK